MFWVLDSVSPSSCVIPNSRWNRNQKRALPAPSAYSSWTREKKATRWCRCCHVFDETLRCVNLSLSLSPAVCFDVPPCALCESVCTYTYLYIIDRRTCMYASFCYDALIYKPKPFFCNVPMLYWEGRGIHLNFAFHMEHIQSLMK